MPMPFVPRSQGPPGPVAGVLRPQTDAKRLPAAVLLCWARHPVPWRRMPLPAASAPVVLLVNDDADDAAQHLAQ